MADNIVTLAELGVDEDPGTAWHPRPSKVGAFMASGDLPDLDDLDVVAHSTKPERYPDSGEPMAAEDSQHSPEGEI